MLSNISPYNTGQYREFRDHKLAMRVLGWCDVKSSKSASGSDVDS